MGSRIGNIAPDFTLTARDGSQVKLSDFRGKIVFLNFWATWCGPCRMEMPDMETLHRELKGKDFIILAVSEDESGWRVIDPFVKELDLSFKVLLDENQKAARQYNSYRFPETFIIGKDGRIIDKRVGPAPWSHRKYLKHFANLAESMP